MIYVMARATGGAENIGGSSANRLLTKRLFAPKTCIAKTEDFCRKLDGLVAGKQNKRKEKF